MSRKPYWCSFIVDWTDGFVIIYTPFNPNASFSLAGLVKLSLHFKVSIVVMWLAFQWLIENSSASKILSKLFTLLA